MNSVMSLRSGWCIGVVAGIHQSRTETVKFTCRYVDSTPRDGDMASHGKFTILYSRTLM